MRRRAALAILRSSEKDVRAVLKKAGASVARRFRTSNKIAKAYPRPGEPGFNPDPPVKPAPAPVDPDSVDVSDIDLADLAELAALADQLGDVGSDAALRLLGQIGLDGSEDIVNLVSRRAVAAAENQAADLVSNVTDATRNMLQRIIAAGLSDNIGTGAIADSIEASAAFGEDRAQLIAHTEVRNANERGVLEGLRGARDAGVIVKKSVLLGPDPCEICLENADVGAIDIDDEFPSGDTEPTFHVRCECALTGVVQDAPVEALAKVAIVTQSSAGYLDQSPCDVACSGCVMFRPSQKFLGSCDLVEGSISPRGWCRYWEKK